MPTLIADVRLDQYGRSEEDYAEDYSDPETVADLIAGRDFYGPSPLPRAPIMDPPGTEGSKAEMGRRAAQGLSLFDPSQDAKENDRIAFVGSKCGYSGGQLRRTVIETSEGVKPVGASLQPRKSRPSERQRSAALREADRRRKRDERARNKKEGAKEAAEAGYQCHGGTLKTAKKTLDCNTYHGDHGED